MSSQHSDSLEISRRRFLLSSSLAATTLVASDAFAQILLPAAPEGPDLNDQSRIVEVEESPIVHEGRMMLLQQIGNVVQTTISCDERLRQMHQIIPLVKQYCESLEQGECLTLKELSEAIAINRFDLNMLYYTRGIALEESTTFICETVLHLYTTLREALLLYREDHPHNEKKILLELDTIRGDIMWSSNHKLGAVAYKAGEIIVEQYLPDTDATDFASLHTCYGYTYLPQFFVPFLRLQPEIIPTLLRKELDAFVVTGPRKKDFIRLLTAFTSGFVQGLKVAQEEDLMSQDEIEQARGWLHDEIALPYAGKAADILLATINDLQKKRAPGAYRPNTKIALAEHVERMRKFFSCFQEDALSLSAALAQGTERLRRDNPENALFIEASYYVLALLPLSDVERAPIAQELEQMFRRAKDERALRKISTLFHMFLFTDDLPHFYDGQIQRKEHQSSSDIIRRCFAGDSQEDQDLSSMQKLLLTLVRNSLQRDQQQDLSYDLAIRVLEFVAYEDLQLTFLSFPMDEEVVNSITFPKTWGETTLQASRAGQREALTQLCSEYSAASDLLAKELSKCRVPLEKGEAELTRRMVFLARMYHERKYRQPRRDPEDSPEILGFKEAFPAVSDFKLTDGPFHNAYKWARNSLYLLRQGRMAPDFKSNEENKDSVLEAQARRYAQTAEEKFFTNLVLALWLEDPEKRPIAHYTVLSDSRMRSEVSSFLYTLNVYRRCDRLRKILEGRGVAAIRPALVAHAKELASSQQQQLAAIAGPRQEVEQSFFLEP